MAQHHKKFTTAVYIVAQDSKRMLMGLRSELVNDPLVWASFGGHSEPGEAPEECAIREVAEEVGYTGPMHLEQVHVPHTPDNEFIFTGVVPVEFEPQLNWETAEARWVQNEELFGLHPRHWGLGLFLEHLLSISIRAQQRD
jgi:8-oxo-dGTP pyrophosphatase MutT (NUDIX family)